MSFITSGAISQSIDSSRYFRKKKVDSFENQLEKSSLFTEFRYFHNTKSFLWNDLELSAWNLDQHHSAFFIPEIGIGLMKDFGNDFELGFGWSYQVYNIDIFSTTATDANRLTKRIVLRLIPF